MPNETVRKLAAQVAALTEEQRAQIAARMPVVTIAGHVLSARNACLLAYQTAEPVTVVGGFRQWLAAGRCVRKGQTALYILRPCTRKADAEAVAQEESSAPAFFIPVPVFDVSQTDELPEDRRPRGWQAPAAQAGEALL